MSPSWHLLQSPCYYLTSFNKICVSKPVQFAEAQAVFSQPMRPLLCRVRLWRQ